MISLTLNSRLRWLALMVATALLGSSCSERPVFSGESFNADPPRPGPLNGYIVITNNGDDTLSVVDPVTRQVRWRIPVGFIPVELEGPHHIVAESSGNFFYINLSNAVAGSGSGPHGAHGSGTIPGFVLKISAQDGSQVAFAQVDPNPGDLTISGDGKTLFVTHYDLIKLGQAARSGNLRDADTNLAVVNAESMTATRRVTLCPVAHGVRLSSDGRTLYSTCGTDEIAIVRLDDPSFPVRLVPLPGAVEAINCRQCPYALGIAPDGTVWVSNLGPNAGVSGGGSIHVYDPRMGAFDTSRSISLCGRALFAAFGPSPAGSSAYRVYVPEQACGDSVRVYEVVGSQAPAAIGQISLPPSACLNAHMIALADDGTARMVCEGNHLGPGTLVFLDLRTMALTSSQQLGIFPDGLDLIPGRTTP